MKEGKRPILALTEGEFIEIQKKAITDSLASFLMTDEFIGFITPFLTKTIIQQEPERKYVTGIKGIAEIFGCSIRRAGSIKQSGDIDDAISQIGRTIRIDVEHALSLTKRKSKYKNIRL